MIVLLNFQVLEDINNVSFLLFDLKIIDDKNSDQQNNMVIVVKILNFFEEEVIGEIEINKII